MGGAKEAVKDAKHAAKSHVAGKARPECTASRSAPPPRPPPASRHCAGTWPRAVPRALAENKRVTCLLGPRASLPARAAGTPAALPRAAAR